MKAERRHELKENELVQWLYSVRDYLNEHGKTVWWVVIIALAILVAVFYVLSSRAQESIRMEEEARALSFTDPEVGKESLARLAALGREATDDSFALSCLTRRVAVALELAGKVDNPPDPALTEHARQACDELTQRFPGNGLAQGTALLGLATVEENLFVVDGDPGHKERCRAHLQAVLERPGLAGMSFQLQATDRLAALDKTFAPVRFAPAPLPAAPPAALPAADSTLGGPATPVPAQPGGMLPEPAPAQPAEEVAPESAPAQPAQHTPSEGDAETTPEPAEPAASPSEE